MNKDIITEKVALIVTKSNWGGAQKYVYDLATNLPKDCFEVLVILGGNGILKEKLVEKNIRVISLPSLQRDIKIKNEIKSFLELFFILKNERPDIVHVNSSKAGGIGAFLSRLLGIRKIIFTAHAWAFNEDRDLLSRIIISFFHWLTVMLTHQTIAVSESVKNQISHLPFMKNKISVVHLGIDSLEFLSKEEARNKLDINVPEDNFVIGTIAELHKIKGLEFAIGAISRISKTAPNVFDKIHYCILGEGEEEDSLNDLIQKKDLDQRVHLFGFRENAASYLKAFDCFLLPSLSEAFGYVLLEAGLAGVPVIATRVGGIPEIITDGENGTLIHSKDSEQISDSILKYADNQSLTKNYSEKLNGKVNLIFSIKNMIEKIVFIYNKK